MNITDVGHLTSDADEGEDKIELGAKREKKSAWEIADFYTEAFKKDLKKLNILEPDIWCKATDNIKEQIKLIKRLEKKGFTYKLEDGIYYDTSKFKDYGKLAKLNIKGLKAGIRVEVVKGKKNVTDFALWKFSPKDRKREMEWNSPWGKGFPGWHIECSAMSMKYLGENFDIHCGGIDHINVHHTNEIAQAEAATGKRWVNYWLHGEFLVFDKGKMAKSSGEFLTLEVLSNKGFDPLAYRYLCLNTHYRSVLNFSFEALESAQNAFNNLKEKILEIKKDLKSKKSDISKYKDEFLKNINDDLNMPSALAVMWSLIKDKDIGNKEKYDLLLEFDSVFGLGFKDFEIKKISKDLLDLVNEREEARKKKNFKKADEIRDKLEKKGVILEDTVEGVKWRLK